MNLVPYDAEPAVPPEPTNRKPVVRPARRDDFQELWKLDQQCFEPGIAYGKVELAQYMRRRGAFTLVAESDCDIAGFVVAECRRGMGHIITIDVHPEYRRAGVGRELMAAAEERLRENACSSVYLETAVDNRAAITFYLRYGYTVLKVIPRYYGGRVDAFVMAKKLGERAAE